MKLRIAFVTPEFVSEVTSGGTAQFLNRLALALLERGHEVHVVTYTENSADEECNLAGINVHRVSSGTLRRALTKLSSGRLRQSAKWIDYAIRAARKVRVLHRKNQFHLVHSSNLYGCGLFASAIRGLPHVVRAGNHRPVMIRRSGYPTTLDDRLLTTVEWLQLKCNRNIYAPSAAVQTMLLEHAHVPNVRVIRSPFFIETKIMDRSIYKRFLDGKNYLLFFGRLQVHKGYHVLAQALRGFFEVEPEAHAAIVGSDRPTRLAASMREYTYHNCNGYHDRLVFLDELPHRQLYPIIAGARITVLPSLIDNLPNACLESLALGTPVVGTIGASFDEIIRDGVNGFLVERDNVDALREKIVVAWNHPQLGEIGRAGAATARELRAENSVEDLLDYCQSLLPRTAEAV